MQLKAVHDQVLERSAKPRRDVRYLIKLLFWSQTLMKKPKLNKNIRNHASHGEAQPMEIAAAV